MLYRTKNANRHATENAVTIETLENGAKYVADLENISPKAHVTDGGNTKTGSGVQSTSMSIAHTCDHNAPCFKSGDCYGCHGTFVFGSNVLDYAETTKAAMVMTALQFACAIVAGIKASTTMFRWFVVGDIPSTKILEAMIIVAKTCPDIKFWAYTKKYRICNRYVEVHGGCIEKALPRNLHILFSEWESEDFRMENPYGFAVSRFIPYGKEAELRKTCTYICPCSDPNWADTCERCGICSNILPGQIVGLLEHSTKATADRDEFVHTSQARARHWKNLVISLDMGKRRRPIVTVSGQIVGWKEVVRPMVTIDGFVA